MTIARNIPPAKRLSALDLLCKFCTLAAQKMAQIRKLSLRSMSRQGVKCVQLVGRPSMELSFCPSSRQRYFFWKCADTSNCSSLSFQSQRSRPFQNYVSPPKRKVEKAIWWDRKPHQIQLNPLGTNPTPGKPGF